MTLTVTRYPKLLELLAQEIQTWETDKNQTFKYDGEPYKQLLEAEDTDRLGLDLRKIGQTNTNPNPKLSSRPTTAKPQDATQQPGESTQLMRSSSSSSLRKGKTLASPRASPRASPKHGNNKQKGAHAQLVQRSESGGTTPRGSAASKRVRSMREAKQNNDNNDTATEANQAKNATNNEMMPFGCQPLSSAAAGQAIKSTTSEQENVDDVEQAESPRKMRKSLDGLSIERSKKDKKKSLGSSDLANVISIVSQEHDECIAHAQNTTEEEDDLRLAMSFGECCDALAKNCL